MLRREKFFDTHQYKSGKSLTWIKVPGGRAGH